MGSLHSAQAPLHGLNELHPDNLGQRYKNFTKRRYWPRLFA